MGLLNARFYFQKLEEGTFVIFCYTGMKVNLVVPRARDVYLINFSVLCVILVICRIHAVATHVTNQFMYDHIDSNLQELGLTDTSAKDIVDPTMEYVGKGYAYSTEEELGE